MKMRISNENIFTLDWAATDPRSVKSYLAGRGDGRTLWWNLNHRVHKMLWPRDTLEAILYAFHCRHHRITFATFIYLMSVQKVAYIIRTDGIFAGVICAISETKNPFR